MGPIYGWSNTPATSGLRRLAPTTPIANLFLAGQWTYPGPGMFVAIKSGIQGARLALGAPGNMPRCHLR